ncbi:MAG: hypothetical protein OXI69_00240 [Acidobacteriota bacterium]|nr:hypothetical protein [Acidobacteriota bacterium]
MSNTPRCFIWGTAAIEIYAARAESGGLLAAAICDSPRAGGKYWISLQAQHFFENPDQFDWIDDALKARLTTWLIEQREAGVECPKIYGRDINKFKTRGALLMKQRAQKLLTYISLSLADAADFFVVKANRGQRNEMLAWSESISDEQLGNVLRYLVESNYLARGSKKNRFRLTATGHEEVAKKKDRREREETSSD